MAKPIYSKDAQGKVVATTHGTIARHYNPPRTVEEMMELQIKEGRIRFADDVPSSVLRLVEHLDRSAGAEGVCIDADDCAGLARDLRLALVRRENNG